jgi:hypothetical protein
MFKRSAAVLLLTLVPVFLLQAFQFRLLEKVKLSQKLVLLAGPSSFFVTEDRLIFVSDFKLGNFKIYKADGSFLKEFGKKGSGPDEFHKPIFATYHNRQFVFFDYGKSRIYLYKRSGEDGLTFEKKWEYVCPALGYNLSFFKDDVVINGYKNDSEGISFEAFSVNIKSEQKSFLLPSKYKYGLDHISSEKFLNYYQNNKEYMSIGLMSYCDVEGEYLYYAWEGILRILKVNLDTKEITKFTHSSENYTRPRASSQLIRAYKERNSKLIQAEKRKLNYVRKVFACKKFFGIVYSKSVDNDTAFKLFFQFYSPDGKFIREVAFPGKTTYEPMIYLEKQRMIFYFLNLKDTDGFDHEFIVSSYKVLN